MMMSDDLSLSRKRRTADLRGRRYDRDQFAIFYYMCGKKGDKRKSENREISFSSAIDDDDHKKRK